MYFNNLLYPNHSSNSTDSGFFQFIIVFLDKTVIIQWVNYNYLPSGLAKLQIECQDLAKVQVTLGLERCFFQLPCYQTTSEIMAEFSQKQTERSTMPFLSSKIYKVIKFFHQGSLNPSTATSHPQIQNLHPQSSVPSLNLPPCALLRKPTHKSPFSSTSTTTCKS